MQVFLNIPPNEEVFLLLGGVWIEESIVSVFDLAFGYCCCSGRLQFRNRKKRSDVKSEYNR